MGNVLKLVTYISKEVIKSEKPMLFVGAGEVAANSGVSSRQFSDLVNI